MRGPAHTFDFRGKPTQNSSFDAYAYGVNDKGLELPDGTRRYEGGYLLTVSGQTALPAGWSARGTYNYLSSFLFRQSFTESFNEAVFSEVNSTVYATRNWSSYHLNVVMTGHTNFMSTMPDDKIDIRKLPQVEFASRYRELIRGDILQVWVSWDASAGLLRRNQPLFQTRKFVDRLDAEPRLMTALRWKEFHLVPWVSVRETYYGSSVQDGSVAGVNLNRFSQEYGADLILPTLVKVFNGPKWMGGRMKHSIEPRAQVRLVRGVGDFNSIIRFDDVDLVANTSEVEYSLTNRLWAKNRDGVVWDWMTWDVRQRRYFDPTFGGAVRPGYRNVFASTADLTAYAFTDQARHYSPVVNSLRVAPRPGFGFEWRADYDPLRGKVTNTIAAADVRKDQYFLSVGHSRIACVPLGSNASSDQPVPGNCVNAPPGTVLSPVSNQLRFLGGIGRENRRGWNAGFLAIYDFATGVMQYANTQVTYNTACCAFSGQYRRFGIGTRNENQFRVAFVVANIGSFGTLKRNERLF
jgi:LPS-assembly protein